MEQMRHMLRGKIHRATVTEADLHYEGSVTIDKNLMAAADILNNERVDVWNIASGARLSTYAIEGPAGSGVVCLNGAAARLVAVGDMVIIACFGFMDSEEAKSYKPRIVLCDENNRIKETRSFEVVEAGLLAILAAGVEWISLAVD